jgi:hypothetical protein
LILFFHFLITFFVLSGDAGASYFAQVLRFNRALEILNLQGCGVTSPGVQALIAAVQRNPIIQRGEETKTNIRVNLSLIPLNTLVMLEAGDDGRALKEGNKALERNQRLAEQLAAHKPSAAAASSAVDSIPQAYTAGMGPGVMQFGSLGKRREEERKKKRKNEC